MSRWRSFGILLIAEIFKQISLNVPLRDLGCLIGQPIQIFDDVVKMLGAVESCLLLGQLPLRPQFKERMVFAVPLVASGDQLVMKTKAHSALRWQMAYGIWPMA